MLYLLGALAVSLLMVKRRPILGFLAFMIFGTVIRERGRKKS